MYLIEGINKHDHNCSLQKPGTQTTGVSNVDSLENTRLKQTNKQKTGFQNQMHPIQGP